MDEIDSCLKDEPGRETRNNKKPSPNRVANRELRSDRFRVFYDIDEASAGVSNSSYENDHDLAPGQERSYASQAGTPGEPHFEIA